MSNVKKKIFVATIMDKTILERTRFDDENENFKNHFNRENFENHKNDFENDVENDFDNFDNDSNKNDFDYKNHINQKFHENSNSRNNRHNQNIDNHFVMTFDLKNVICFHCNKKNIILNIISTKIDSR